MRTTALTTLSGALFVALVLSYLSTGARIAELEARVEVLDDNFVHLSIPLEDSKRDISGIYEELDRIRGDADSGFESGGVSKSRSAGAQAVVSRPVPKPAHEPRMTALLPDEDAELPYHSLDNRLNNPQGTFNDASPDEEH